MNGFDAQRPNPPGLRSISYDLDYNKLPNKSPSSPSLFNQRQVYQNLSNYVKRGPVQPAAVNLANNTVEDLARKKESGQDSTLGNVMSDQVKVHNPITNPLAYVNQNPYVQKQMEHAKQSKVIDQETSSPAGRNINWSPNQNVRL